MYANTKFHLQVICLLIGSLFITISALANKSPLVYRQQNFEVAGQTYQVRVAEGYQLELLSDKLRGPRLLSFHANGDLLIGSRSGDIYRLQPPYTRAQTLITLNDYPHSVVVRGKELFIARTSGLYRVPYEPGQKKIAEDDLQLIARIPGGGGHNSRSLAVGPDRRLYLSLGITGNCSNEYLDDSYDFDERRGGILVLDENSQTAQWKTFASGLRNPVGFAWHPVTGVMYASNNGPDHWGFEQPPEYFSRIDAGSFHGMPWFQFNGQQIVRDDCIKTRPPRPMGDVVKPVATFPARNAPMAVAFMPDTPAAGVLRGDAIVALRGSWATAPNGGFFGDNASRRTPRLVRVRFESGQAVAVEDLLSGFQLPNGDRWARPVGLAIDAEGAIYFTSDSGINGLFRLRRVSR